MEQAIGTTYTGKPLLLIPRSWLIHWTGNLPNTANRRVDPRHLTRTLEKALADIFRLAIAHVHGNTVVMDWPFGNRRRGVLCGPICDSGNGGSKKNWWPFRRGRAEGEEVDNTSDVGFEAAEGEVEVN